MVPFPMTMSRPVVSLVIMLALLASPLSVTHAKKKDMFAANSNDESSDERSICDEYKNGHAFGLCVAYCKAKKCFSIGNTADENLRGRETSCTKLKENFLRITGGTSMPCEEEEEEEQQPSTAPTKSYLPTVAPSDSPTEYVESSKSPTGPPSSMGVECPCWTEEEITTFPFPTGKVCSFTGPEITSVRDAEMITDENGFSQFRYMFAAYDPPNVDILSCLKFSDGVRTDAQLTPEELDFCSQQIMQHCINLERQEDPQVTCPCWPNGFEGPSPPAIYEGCILGYYETYERFDYSWPCDVLVYETSCGGGLLPSLSGFLRCNNDMFDDTPSVDLSEAEYEACKKVLLDTCDEFAESYYF